MRQGRIFSPSLDPSWPVHGDQHRPNAVWSCSGADSHVSVTAPDNLGEQKVIQKKAKGAETQLLSSVKAL